MKRGIFVTIIFFVLIIIFFGFYYYNFRKNGNNKIIKDVNQAEAYILNIGNYSCKAEITITSNKNENIYSIEQKVDGNYKMQKGLSGEIEGIIIENSENKVNIKNSKLELSKIYDDYSYMTDNILFLDTFVKEWKESEEKEVTEEEQYFRFYMKIKNGRNRYVQYKSLWINKDTSKPQKLEIEDINKNRTIYILYKEIEIEK